MGNQACGPSSRRIRSKAVNGAYGPLSGWYDIARAQGETSSCGTCSAYCFWTNTSEGDPGLDPHDRVVSPFNEHNRWACILGGGGGLWYPEAWPRDYVHLRCAAGRDAPITDALYRMSASPVFFAALLVLMLCFVVRILYVFRQRRRYRKVHCCAAAPPQESERCPAGCCYCPARPRWLDFEGDGGIEPGVQLRQSLLYDSFDDMRAMHLTALIMETLN